MSSAECVVDTNVIFEVSRVLGLRVDGLRLEDEQLMILVLNADAAPAADEAYADGVNHRVSGEIGGDDMRFRQQRWLHCLCVIQCVKEGACPRTSTLTTL